MSACQRRTMLTYLDKEAAVSKMEIVQKEGGRNVRRKPGMSQDS